MSQKSVVSELSLCEQNQLVLMPGKTYRFTIDWTCEACLRIAYEHKEDILDPEAEYIPESIPCGMDDRTTRQSFARAKFLAKYLLYKAKCSS